MKTSHSLALVVLIFAVSFPIGIGIAALADKKAELPALTVKSLTVKGEEGKGSVAISVTDKGPGVWLTSPKGDHINICALDDGTNHTVYLMKKDGKFGNVGIAMSPSGEAVFQFVDSKGNPRHLPLEKLANLVK